MILAKLNRLALDRVKSISGTYRNERVKVHCTFFFLPEITSQVKHCFLQD